MKNLFYQILKYMLLIVSCGFYCLPVAAWECPGHPRTMDEIVEDNEREQREKDSTRHLGDDNQKESHKDGDGRWV